MIGVAINSENLCVLPDPLSLVWFKLYEPDVIFCKLLNFNKDGAADGDDEVVVYVPDSLIVTISFGVKNPDDAYDFFVFVESTKYP